jgi:hypothetical protein
VWPASPQKGSAPSRMTRLATFDIRPTDSAVDYIKQHAKSEKPFFMDVNFIKMHNPTNAAPEFRGRSHPGDYSDSLMEMDADIGRIMDELRAEAPNTIVILTADNGAWAGCLPRRWDDAVPRREGLSLEGGWRVPAIMWWPNHIPADVRYDEMMSHIDAWATLAAMVGLTPPPHDWVGNDGQPIYFDSIDNSAYILGKAPHSARTSWIYIDGENFEGARADIGGDPKEPWVHIAWKYLFTAKDSWLGVTASLGSIGALYNLTIDPYEKYDVVFNGAAPTRALSSSPGKYAGEDNGWVLSLIYPVMIDFDKSIMKYPSITRYVGGASNDLVPNLQHPENPVPLLKNQLNRLHIAGAGGGLRRRIRGHDAVATHVLADVGATASSAKCAITTGGHSEGIRFENTAGDADGGPGRDWVARCAVHWQRSASTRRSCPER